MTKPAVPTRCECGNDFDGDNLCMVSACQWEGIKSPPQPSWDPEDLKPMMDAVNRILKSLVYYGCFPVTIMVGESPAICDQVTPAQGQE